MKFGFATKIAIVLAITLAAGVAMTGVLSMHKYERTFADMLTSRFQFVVNDIRQKIETQMDLGIALSDLENVSGQLEAYLSNDNHILSIEIFDEFGSVLFSTDPSFIGDLVAKNWILKWQESIDESSWSALEHDAGVVGVNLQNNLNQIVGSVALRYTREFLDQSVGHQTERLVMIGAVIALSMTILSFIGCKILLRRSFYDWRNMGKAMQEIIDRRKNSDTLKEAQTRHPEFDEFSHSALTAMDKLDKATTEIRRINEETV